MRAAVMTGRGGVEVLSFTQAHPEPKLLEPTDVLVRIQAVSVNPVDTHIRSGRIMVSLKFPCVVGSDASGVVEAVGPGVTRFKVGDRVFGMLDYASGAGCYAELARFKEAYLAPAPASLSPVEAASLPLVALTVWQSLVAVARPQPGQRLLIHGGSGGVGSFAIQVAKHLGCTVYTTSSARNADYCRKLGADEVIDYTAGDFRQHPGLSDLDIVFDAVGGYYQRSVGLLRKSGVYVSVALLSDAPEFTIPNLLRHMVRLGVAQVRRPFGFPIVRSINVRPEGRMLEEIRALVDAGHVRPVVSHSLPLQDIRKAHEMLESQRTRGKIVLTVS